MCPAADRFENFERLSKAKKEGRDYVIHYRSGQSGILVMAPHGGKIEPGTSELARWIARNEHSLYLFEGIQPVHNFRDLHLTGTRFNEPLALQSAASARHVLTIHGQENSTEQKCIIGGLDGGFAKALEDALSMLGIPIETQHAKLSGFSPQNICNRNGQGRGVQLEISKQLRQRLLWDLSIQRKFVDTVRDVLMSLPANPV